ncbi:MAG TPA: LysR substrate-binding domain-containing protein [Rhizobium sp.]
MVTGFPQSTLRVFEARTADCNRMLSQSELDIAIHVGTGKEDASNVLFTERLYLISQKPLPQAMGNTIPFRSLSEVNIILPAKANPIRMAVDKACMAEGLNLNIVMEIDGQDTVKRAVEDGVATSIMSWNSVRKECHSKTLRAYAITDPDIYRSIFLSTASQFDRRCLEPLREIIRNIVHVERE